MATALGVYRENEFSPGKVAVDASILDAVMAQLNAAGLAIVLCAADEFARQGAAGEHALVMAMCQSEAALARLAAAEQAGALAINSAHSIRSCYRDRMGAALTAAKVPAPPGILVDTADASSLDAIGGLEPARGIYVKRGDLHALNSDDVLRTQSVAQLRMAIEDFARRGVSRAYLQQAVAGRVLKFYGVSDGEYFAIPEADASLPPSMRMAIGAAAERAAAALGLQVWGGDAIVEGDHFELVDFNDWPSFGAVRAQAAPLIARRALELLADRDTKQTAERVGQI